MPATNGRSTFPRRAFYGIPKSGGMDVLVFPINKRGMERVRLSTGKFRDLLRQGADKSSEIFLRCFFSLVRHI
jgi:hypothetical protein